MGSNHPTPDIAPARRGRVERVAEGRLEADVAKAIEGASLGVTVYVD